MKKQGEVGLVQFKEYSFGEEVGLRLWNGKQLWGITVRYETYGTLNAERSNAVLVIHALTGNHHAAGRYSKADQYPGWWNAMIGPGKAFDTEQFFVVCTNNLGGCSGTTGPNALNPKSGQPYGMDFPVITVEDMVEVQRRLMEELELPYWHAVGGGSMGGMLALYWSVKYPKQVKRVIAIATTAAQGPQAIAFSEVGRQAIMRDPAWKGGNYFKQKNTKGPTGGLAVARMLAHITYLSDQAMRKKFGRRLSEKEKLSFTFGADFEVERYLRYQGSRFTDQFDANSYLYITKALNYFDLGAHFGGLTAAFRRATARYLVVSFSSDWLYPSYLSEELVSALLKAGRETSYTEIKSEAGHDAFLLEWQALTRAVEAFL